MGTKNARGKKNARILFCSGDISGRENSGDIGIAGKVMLNLNLKLNLPK
jgi:hypothetical protein